MRTTVSRYADKLGTVRPCEGFSHAVFGPYKTRLNALHGMTVQEGRYLPVDPSGRCETPAVRLVKGEKA